MKIAFGQTVTNPAMRMTMKMLEVVHNRDLPDELFLLRKNGEISAKLAVAEPLAPSAIEEAASAPVASGAPAK